MNEEYGAGCTDRSREFLPWYLKETLSLHDKNEVEAHLAMCPKCRKELEELRWVSNGMKEIARTSLLSHIPPEKLVVFLEEPQSLTPDEKKTIEKHLKSCGSCRDQLQTLKSANLELEALEEEQKPRPAMQASLWQRITQTLIWLVRKPAFAYAIVILLAYPALRWILQQPQPTFPSVISEKVYLLSEQTRLTAKPTPLLRSDKERFIRLSVPFWPNLDTYSYQIAIKNEGGRTLFEMKDFVEFGSQGLFQLALNTDSFGDGAYVLVIREKDKKDPSSSSETLFPFQITHKE